MTINIFEGGRRATQVILWLMFGSYMLSMWLIPERDSKTELSIFFGCVYGGFYLFTKAIGWIVRGIFGIPRGQDFPLQR